MFPLDDRVSTRQIHSKLGSEQRVDLRRTQPQKHTEHDGLHHEATGDPVSADRAMAESPRCIQREVAVIKEENRIICEEKTEESHLQLEETIKETQRNGITKTFSPRTTSKTCSATMTTLVEET